MCIDKQERKMAMVWLGDCQGKQYIPAEGLPLAKHSTMAEGNGSLRFHNQL